MTTPTLDTLTNLLHDHSAELVGLGLLLLLLAWLGGIAVTAIGARR